MPARLRLASPTRIHPMHREHRLREIDADSSNLFHDFAFLVQIEQTEFNLDTSMPSPGWGSPYYSLDSPHTWGALRMDALKEQDVPYGDNWDSSTEVAAWAEAADRKRPWRSLIRDHIAGHVAMLPPGARVLELGSGPGFLAHRVLQRCPHLASYTLLDFSKHMVALSQERLAAFPAASFLLASFKSEDWTRRVVGQFDCVLSMQAVHELRNKRHASQLYVQIYQVLAAPGSIMICDHTPFDDSAASTALYMTEHEQQEALAEARFANVRIELSMNGLVLYAGERAV